MFCCHGQCKFLPRSKNFMKLQSWRNKVLACPQNFECALFKTLRRLNVPTSKLTFVKPSVSSINLLLCTKIAFNSHWRPFHRRIATDRISITTLTDTHTTTLRNSVSLLKARDMLAKICPRKCAYEQAQRVVEPPVERNNRRKSRRNRFVKMLC